MTPPSHTDGASGGGGDGGSDDGDGGAEGQYVPETCIGFDVAADFAHFRRVGNNSAKPTYGVPPRTTLAGMLAGILGLPRDSYYDLFAPDSSALAVVIEDEPHTHTMAITTVNTNASEAIKNRPKGRHYTRQAEMLTPESYVTEARQRDTYQMLVDPTYRVYVALEDDDIHAELCERLLESRYVYSPSLGLSECIADIRNVERHGVEPTTAEAVDSVAYDDAGVVPQPGVSLKRERAPLFMEATNGGRRTTAYGNITYPADAGSIRVNGIRTHAVGQHEVVFY